MMPDHKDLDAVSSSGSVGSDIDGEEDLDDANSNHEGSLKMESGSDVENDDESVDGSSSGSEDGSSSGSEEASSEEDGELVDSDAEFVAEDSNSEQGENGIDIGEYEEVSESGEEESDESGSSSEVNETEKNDAMPTVSIVDAGVLSDSSDGESEKCAICLLSFNKQQVATPERCDHCFCRECLEEWAKNVNTCPIDRQPFTLILIRKRLGGRVIETISITQPAPVDLGEAEEDITFCEVCGESTHEERLLLCDGCDLGYHLECLQPPLDHVPVEQWFCPDCEVHITHREPQIPIDHQERRALPRTRLHQRVIQAMGRNRQERVYREETTAYYESAVESDTAGPSTEPKKKLVRKRKTTRGRKRTKGRTKKTKYTKKKTTTRKKTTKRKTTKESTTRKTIKKRVVKKKTTTKRKTTRKQKTGKRKSTKKGRKRKGASRRTAPRVVNPKSVKGRLAEQLGMRLPKPWYSLPTMATSGNTTEKGGSSSERSRRGINNIRSKSGIPTLSLFGHKDQLDFGFSSGDEDLAHGSEGGGVAVQSSRRTNNVPGLKHKKLKSAVVQPPAPLDLLGSILDDQSALLTSSSPFFTNNKQKDEKPKKNYQPTSCPLVSGNNSNHENNQQPYQGTAEHNRNGTNESSSSSVPLSVPTYPPPPAVLGPFPFPPPGFNDQSTPVDYTLPQPTTPSNNEKNQRNENTNEDDEDVDIYSDMEELEEDDYADIEGDDELYDENEQDEYPEEGELYDDVDMNEAIEDPISDSEDELVIDDTVATEQPAQSQDEGEQYDPAIPSDSPLAPSPHTQHDELTRTSPLPLEEAEENSNEEKVDVAFQPGIHQAIPRNFIPFSVQRVSRVQDEHLERARQLLSAGLGGIARKGRSKTNLRSEMFNPTEYDSDEEATEAELNKSDKDVGLDLSSSAITDESGLYEDMYAEALARQENKEVRESENTQQLENIELPKCAAECPEDINLPSDLPLQDIQLPEDVSKNSEEQETDKDNNNKNNNNDDVTQGLGEDIESDEMESFDDVNESTTVLDDSYLNKEVRSGLEGLETETVSDTEDPAFEAEINDTEPIDKQPKKKRHSCEDGEIVEEGRKKSKKERGSSKKDKSKSKKQDKEKEPLAEKSNENSQNTDNWGVANWDLVETPASKEKLINRDTQESTERRNSREYRAKSKERRENRDKKNKEQPGVEFKKLSQHTKERNYRDVKKKDDEPGSRKRSREKSGKRKSKDREKKEKDRKKVKRQELERYSVRKIVSVRSQQDAENQHTDQYGRNLSRERSRSRSKKKKKRRRSLSKTRSPSLIKWRSTSRGRSGSRGRRSGSKVRSRSRSSIIDHSTPQLYTVHSRTTSPSFHSRSRSPPLKRHRQSRSVTPRLVHRQMSRSPVSIHRSGSDNLDPAEIAISSPAEKELQKKKKDKQKDLDESESLSRRKKKKKRRARSPPPSKEVYATGNNIVVSVNYGKSGSAGPKDPNKTKDKRKKKYATARPQTLLPRKMVCIDLISSPVEIEMSPVDVITLSDSADEQEIPAREPTVKFTITCKGPTRLAPSALPQDEDMNIISNKITETQQNKEVLSDVVLISPRGHHSPRGPSTPPEPPQEDNSQDESPHHKSAPCSPRSHTHPSDTYDPFEPTKSPSPQPTHSPCTPPPPSPKPPTTIIIPEKQPQVEEVKLDIETTPSQPVLDTSKGTPTMAMVRPNVPIQLPTPLAATPTNPLAILQRPPTLSSVLTSIMRSALPIPNIPNIVTQSASSPLPRTATVQPMIQHAHDSPRSPGSSEGSDLFDPPSAPVAQPVTQPALASKPQNKFDSLFGTHTRRPAPKPASKPKPAVNKGHASQPVKKPPTVSATINKPAQRHRPVPSKAKHVKVTANVGAGDKKLTGKTVAEDQLQILEELPNSAVEMEYLKKLNRQERVVEEVKLVLKPVYHKKVISKEEYKSIMRRAVPKICHNRSGEINPVKVKSLVDAYIKQSRYQRKQGKVGSGGNKPRS